MEHERGRVQHQPADLERDGERLGLVPCYLKSHSQGEYVFDHGWADAYERAGGSYYPKLQVSVPFTPVTGPRFLVAPGQAPDEAAAALQQRTDAAGNKGEADQAD